jgi:endonuclease/exonuclease/phosphatase (EEP) superfamily protein YafD
VGIIGQAPRGNAVGRTWRASLRFLGVGCVALAALGWAGPSLVGALSSPWMVQVWSGLAGVSVMLALVREWRLLIVLVPALAALTLWVFPVLVPSETPAPSRTLRIAFANVNAWNAPSEEAVRWFASTGADAVALIECSPEWADAIRAVAESDGRMWPHECVRFDGEPIAGVALFARHPLRDAQAFIGPEGRFPMVDAVIESPDGPLRLMVAHPLPPVGLGAMDARNAEINWLAQRCSESTVPTAIVADFNDTDFGRALADFRAGSGMRSSASATGLVTTWPARVAGMPWPAPLRIAIDHCFVSREIGIAAFLAGPDIGSDHLPLVIDVAHEPRDRGR